MGRIGAAVAQWARAFGMDVAGARRGESIDDLLAKSDIVSIHTPLTPETRHMINRETIARMKRGAYLINTARGPVVDESALCDALESGQLRGAGLDVYEDEPRVSARLAAMPNIVVLPHIGSATEETRNAMARIAATEVAHFLRRESQEHRVA
jgi:phosphoglycerate dehydrogenase-like enzyme